jgi:hypothetical protein
VILPTTVGQRLNNGHAFAVTRFTGLAATL